jgi:hypothetical protein
VGFARGIVVLDELAMAPVNLHPGDATARLVFMKMQNPDAAEEFTQLRTSTPRPNTG